jgi:hypothetical protein
MSVIKLPKGEGTGEVLKTPNIAAAITPEHDTYNTFNIGFDNTTVWKSITTDYDGETITDDWEEVTNTGSLGGIVPPTISGVNSYLYGTSMYYKRITLETLNARISYCSTP